MEVTTKTIGLDKLKARAQRMTKTVRRRMTEAAKTNARMLKEAAERDAPVLTGELRLTIRYYAARGSDGLIWRVVAGNVRDEEGLTRARWQEFGTVDQPANPFFFSNYRIMKPRFSARMSRAMSKGIRESKA